MRRPITHATVIALALGAAAVVAPTTHAAGYGLRGEDGTGVIARGEQEASQLPAGKCSIVVSGDDAYSGSQHGFTWDTYEPIESAGYYDPNKTKWGVGIALDNSGNRTFADWYFTSSGRMSAYLNTGEVPAMDAGQSYFVNNATDWTATHRADENIKITASGQQRNLNVFAELTDEKVKQYAQATKDSPVRYAWQGEYTQEYPKGVRATQGNSAEFGAYVNPWPSENIECNPITTTWDKVENHVITPGEETKVGHINVPALSDGTVDDSLSRMVVEAYSTDGKLIGTSDTTAGTKNRLRIADNGDVFFTWPDYRDPDNKVMANQSVQFSTIALPRSVEQLQAAGVHNTKDLGYDNSGRQFAFESSNILPRYNTPNEIDKHTISLDDTTKHDPQYEESTRSFVSGIIDGAPSNERKEIVFTQVGDLIGDMVAREGKPNNKVKVELDTTYVYSGWKAEFVDPDNGNYDVRVTAPANPRAGEFARPLVKVSYTNGSEDHIPILTIVDPNHTQQMDLAYERVPVATPGEPNTVDAKLTRAIGDGDIVTPTKYVLDTSGLPDGWAAEVDQATGNVVVTPSVNAPNGEQFIGKVTATYPDGTTDTAEVNVMAVSAVKTANYDAKTLYPGTPVELVPNVADKDATGGDGPAPTRYTFAGGKTTTVDKGVTLTIDPDTGVITADAGDVPNGTHVKVPVEMTFPIGPVQTTNAEVVAVVAPTRPVPFEVETIFDDTVPAGEARVTREGVQGIESVQPDGSWKVTTKPVNAQVTVGTKPAIATAEQTWKLPIPHDTERKPNPELKPGETRVVQKGVAGERALTVNVTAQGGKAEIAPTTNVREPVTEIIEYGPDKATSETVTTRKVPFTTKIIYDPELPEGTNKTDQEGKDGSVTTTATQHIVDGKPDGKPVITEEVTDAVEMIVRVGTKKVETDVVGTITQPVTPKTRVEYDPTLAAGEVVESNPGKDGEKTITITHKVVGGKPVGEQVITEKVTREPEDRVLRVGTKQTTAPGALRWDVPLPYPTELRENKDLAPGEIREVRPGKDGVATYAASFAVEGTATKTATEKNRTEPVARIVEYGPRGTAVSVESVIERPIEFATKVVEDPTLPKGEQVIDQGEFGRERVTVSRSVHEGTVGEPVETVERVTEPKDAVIRVGTGERKPVDADVELPFGTRIVFDPSLEPGQEVEDTPGKNGTARVTFKDGKATVNVVNTPVDRVVRVGTKPTEHTWTERIPFDVEVRENPARPAGEHEVIREGEEGTRVHVGDEVTDTKKPVDMVVEVGTKQPDEPSPVVTDVDVPYSTKIVYDPELRAGEEVEDVAGRNGTLRVTARNGESSVKEVRPMTPRVVRVGTKPITPTWTERVPFDVEVRENPDRPAGEHKVVRKGTPGTIEHVDGKQVTVTESVSMVIEVGTKQPTPPTPDVPAPAPQRGSSETAKRCVANATAANSPLLWLLPVALLSGVGYGVNKAFAPQIAQAQAKFNEVARRHTPAGHGSSEPEWARSARMQADAFARGFAGVGEELRPVATALGVIAALAVFGGLMYQACQEEGFDAWFGSAPDGSSNK